MSAIDASGLTKIYRRGFRGKTGVTALNNLSLTVERGEVFGFLGPNGAGKTTLVKVLLSLVRPTAGQASLLDTRLPDTRVRERIGYLPENHRFPGYLTGEQVLRLFGRLSGVTRPVLDSRIPELLRLVGMEQWKAMKVKRYSKGMLQRIGLAQALANDPDLLFLDEPTDGVDPVGRKEIRDILRDLRSKGKTIFLNSHLLSEVELVCDRVAIVDKGSLLKIGTIAEMTEGGAQYTIGIDGELPESALMEAKAMVVKFTMQPGALVVDAGTTRELNNIIDLLRRHGVMITSLHQQKTTLEESFLALLKREGEAAS